MHVGYDDDVDFCKLFKPSVRSATAQVFIQAMHKTQMMKRAGQLEKEGYKAREEEWQSTGTHWDRLSNAKDALFHQALIFSISHGLVL